MKEKKIIDLKKFFIEDNKSGHKTKEKWLINNHVDLYNEIISFSKHIKDIVFKQRVYLYINQLSELPKCECGKQLKFKKSLKEGYGKYCSVKCTNQSKEHKERVKKTNNLKYGGNAPISSKKVKDKIANTNKKKYGVENIFENIDYIKQKTIEKYGIEHISKLNSTKEKIAETNKEKYGVSTPLMLSKNRKISFENKKNKFIKKYENLDIVNIKNDNITINCDICKRQYEINRNVLYHRFEITNNPCTLCNPIKSGTSIAEKEIINHIKSLGIKVIENERNIIKPFEIDIYIPEFNIAIEYNGLHWHSEKYIDKYYHLNKTILCNDKGIKLIHIFEDEWIYKKEIVKSRLNNIFNKSKNRIYARKCEIREVKTKDKTKFIERNHIQGSTGSKINLGLYYDDELVSIMTFGSYRKVLGLRDKKDCYELIRFCNKLDTNVIGGASKLLKYFTRNYGPKEIISYADRRWSTGKLYNVLGFNFKHNSSPNYFYVVNNKREHRFKYRKDILVKQGYDEKLTEKQIMKNRNIYRIYDCGTITYFLNLF